MPPNIRFSPNTSSIGATDIASSRNDDGLIRCAILGVGMMGQEHVSYVMGYPNDIRIDFLVDPFEPSLDKAQKMMKDFQVSNDKEVDCQPVVLRDEEELLQRADEIDLLVIATPNYLHTDSLLRWGKLDITILVEKPVAVSKEQHSRLQTLSQDPEFRACIWVAMEYRYIPAVAKLVSLLPSIGDLKMITIRENRYPFLHKIGTWNRDPDKTGDTLVEKCCHFFDLFRLISNQEIELPKVRALAQRGLNYQDEPVYTDISIIDSAYVVMPFHDEAGQESDNQKYSKTTTGTIGCLELCMYAEGSRHQEEIIVTGTKGRLEAYLPENKVYHFERPSLELWSDRNVPPPPSSIRQQIYDCSDVKSVHGIDADMPTHGGYHYSSTAVEWYRLLQAMKNHSKTGVFTPEVSLQDGLRAVEIGLEATSAVVNEQE